MSEFQTPLYVWHSSHGAKMAPFAGWIMPIQYEGILAEHQHTREHASIFDICHMGEFLISGNDADDALRKAVSHNLGTLAPGRCRYGFILNENGGVIDDCIIYRFEADSFMIVVNAACAERDFNVLRQRLPQNVKLEDISQKTAKIDLQGPESLDVLEKLLQTSLRSLPYFGFKKEQFNNSCLLISRTGYTGELGFELYIDANQAENLWNALLSDARVKPAGLGARDTLRLEAGLPLYGHELDENHSPVEAGMEKMLTSDADYTGRDGVHIIKEKLIPLQLEGRRTTRNGDLLLLPDGTKVGKTTSGSFAPSLGYAVALAWVAAEYAENENFIIQTERAKLTAKRVDLPFYKNGTARKKF